MNNDTNENDKKKLPPYFKSLNPEQKDAVMHEGSSLLILAGAGSGKTRVITTKIAYLIAEKNIDPRSILAVTFTKKAANEMKELAINLEPRSQDAQIRTFHSFGAWFLRLYSKEAALDSSFTVYDDDDMAALVSKVLPSVKARHKGNRFLEKAKPQLFAHWISLAKDYFLTSQDDLSFLDNSGILNEVYELYEKRLAQTGNADFGDLIMKPIQVMNSFPEIRKQMHYRFCVIMVDEYQDSNIAQFRLLQTLSGVTENSGNYVCVVGDDDQSIYKFRGAEIQNILSFQEKFPGTKIIKLVRNYRSTKKILALADAVVSNNEGRLGKTLVAECDEGKDPVIAYITTTEDEAIVCSDMIKKSVENKKATYSDWAILYRTNAQSLSFEQEFLRKKIPYVLLGTLKFYEREEVKDILAFLSLIANPHDELAFRRIVNKPTRGIGEKSQDAIVDYSRAKQIDILKGARNCESLSKKARNSVKDFCAMFKEFEKAFGSGEKLSFLVEKIMRLSGLLEYYKMQDEISETQKVTNMEELMNNAAVYECTTEGLLEFLDTITLDRMAAEENNSASDRVSLATLHNTKGLEFSRVIITGMENGMFPRNEKHGEDLEEERRLFYVGITRAKKELYLTSCAFRKKFGRLEKMMPSVFLDEIEESGVAFRIIGKKPEYSSSEFSYIYFDESGSYKANNEYKTNSAYENSYSSHSSDSSYNDDL
ncbi:MAG: UvrD-helicase domain-containing protein, partial [Treponema sp.]|nr:UvrD-helicase domain-containing protein [Treponema sp.]